MNKTLCALLFLLSGALLYAQDTEPPRGYRLIIGDREIRVHSGEAITLEGTFSNPRIMLLEDDYRQFEYADLSFSYPAYFTFEADTSLVNYQDWTLSGNDFKIIVMRIRGAITADMFARNLEEQFEDTRLEPVSRRFGEGEFEGVRVVMTVNGVPIMQEIFVVRGGSFSTVLTLQDNPGPGGRSSGEGSRVLELFAKEFEIR